MEHLVSIIMPCYNSEQTIARAINSILEQSYPHWELLITDDNSNDNSIQVIEPFLVDSRIKLFKLTNNSGAGIARNISIKNSKGRFIAFCDSDDYWLSTKLSLHIPFMLNNSIALSYTDYFLDYGQNLPRKKVNSLPSLTYHQMLKNNYIGCLTAIYDTEALGKIYMNPVRKRQDWILWLDILQKADKAIGLNIPLSVYNTSNNSLSSNKLKLVNSTWYVYKEYLNQGTIKSIFCMIRFIFSYLKKKQLIENTYD